MPLAKARRSPREPGSSSSRPSRDEPLDRVVQAADALRQRLEVAELEALPEDRRDRKDVARLLRQPLDPSRHGLLDRLRQHVGGETRRAGEVQRSRVVLGDRARIEERPHELLREERVSLRGLEEARREAVGDLAAAGRPLDERAVLGDRERAERDRGESRVAAEGLQHLHERMALVDLRLAVRAHDERGRGSEPSRDVLERLDGELGAVQLLEDEDERLPVRRCASACARSARRRRSCPRPSSRRAPGPASVAADRSSPISPRTGKRASRSPARSEKSGRDAALEPASLDRK